MDTDMKEFKIGDKVTLREDSDWNDGSIWNPLGVRGTIDKISSSEGFGEINVNWENGTNAYYENKDLKIVRIRDTKIARKVYPKYKPTGDGWLEANYE